MIWNEHLKLEGLHAPFSASQHSWLNYDDERIVEVYKNKRAAEYGTRLHAWAKETIELGIRQQKSKKTIYNYVNDAIGFHMKPEVVLYYSDRFFGTTDTISFNKNFLRIHDLKTGRLQASMDQLYIYAALFCLEYKVNPTAIEIELRIYQNDEIQVCTPDPNDISDVMQKIVHFDSLLIECNKEE